METAIITRKIGEVELHFQRDGQGGYWFSGEEIGRFLEYSHPRIAIDKLFQKNRDILGRPEYSSITKLVTEAGERESRIYSEEGVNLLFMYSKQPKARVKQMQIARIMTQIRRADLTGLEGKLAETGQEVAKLRAALDPEQEKLYQEYLEADYQARKAQRENAEITRENKMLWAYQDGLCHKEVEYWQMAWLFRISRELGVPIKGVDWTPARRVMRVAFDLKR